MALKKIRKIELIKEITNSLDQYPTPIFLKMFPEIIKSHLPISKVIFYHKSSAGDHYSPYSDDSISQGGVVIKESSKIISAFSKNHDPFLISEKEDIYGEIFNKETDNLLKRYGINLIIPLHFKAQLFGLIFAKIGKKDKRRIEEILVVMQIVCNIFIPRIEIERVELSNDRNYYKLFRFDRLVLLGEMVASFAHEFRTPLQTMQLEIKELADFLPSNPDHEPVFNKLNNQISRLRQLINSLLSFSKVQTISREKFYLKPYIDTLLQDIPQKKIPRDVSIKWNIAEDVLVFTDKNRLRQVITNILFNALDAVGQKGVIKIEGYMESKGGERYKKCILSIKDNGPGIPQTIKERIFEPFFTTKETGTGLGLYISYGIIESLKGNLEIESSSSGTSFFIHLPGVKPFKGEHNED